MRIKELHIKDHNVIKDAHFTDMGNTVVIAGPNGVGKTTVKSVIIQTFSNGHPPNGSKIVLEATNEEERAQLGGDEEISLPNNNFFRSVFQKQRKKISAKTRLLHINSERQIQNVSFQQYGLNQLGDPETEETNHGYSLNNVNDRFQDVLNTLYRLKTKLVTQYGLKAVNQFESSSTEATSLVKIQDPTEQFIRIFNELLYPKKMAPIRPESQHISFYDEEGIERNFSQLSSGEKEVIAITFDIQLQNPEDCVILIDEPELHLHPELSYRLLKNLSSIGKNNQFILFTHSADIIGASFDSGVWFLRPKSKSKNDNQVKRIDRNSLADFSDIPNLREAIGMLSLGKKLVFIEGEEVSIDRSVFSTIALSSKKDIAIIPSSNCRMIENLSHFSDVLSKGIFGLELKMIRDRDGLTDEKIAELTNKSGGRLTILPYYHIENIFLDADAILAVTENLLSTKKKKTRDEILNEILQISKKQISFCASNYVRQEIHLSSPKLDLSPRIRNEDADTDNLVLQMSEKRELIIKKITSEYSDSYIRDRLNFWKEHLEASIKDGWTIDAQKLFYGKSILSQLNKSLMGSTNVLLWEQILLSSDSRCKKAVEPLNKIIKSL